MSKDKIKDITGKGRFKENPVLGFNHVNKNFQGTNTQIAVHSWTNEEGITFYEFKKLHKNGVEVQLFQTTNDVLEAALTAKDQNFHFYGVRDGDEKKQTH